MRSPDERKAHHIRIVVTHKRPHQDELFAWQLAAECGQDYFPGISDADQQAFDPGVHLDGRAETAWLAEGVLFLGCRGGMFDHHPHEKFPDDCTFTLMAAYLGVEGDPAVRWLARYVLQADHNSTSHPLLFSEVLKHLYRKLPANDVVLLARTVCACLYETQRDFFAAAAIVRAAKRLVAADVESLRLAPEEGCAIPVVHGRTGKVVTLFVANTDNEHLSAAARAKDAGLNAALVIHRHGDHTYISANKRLLASDLRELIAALRCAEQAAAGNVVTRDPERLRAEGTIPEVPEWCYQYGIFNGSLTHPNVPRSKLPLAKIAAEAVTFLQQQARLP